MNELTIKDIVEVFRDKSKLETFIQNMTSEEFKDFLLTLHSNFIGIPKSEDKIYDDFVGVGVSQGHTMYLCAPDIEIKEHLLSEIPKCLKKCSSNRDRGILLHYLINELHLFSDGNGRTGRSMLELFLNEDFDLNNETFKHKTSDQIESKGQESFEMEKKYGIKQIDRVISYTSYLVAKALYEKGLIDSKIEIDKFTSASCNTDALKDEDYIKDEGLTQKEIEQVSLALRDGTGAIGPGALTLLVMKKEKGQQTPDSIYDERYIIAFDLGESKHFEGWNTEDYRKAIEIHNKIQEMQLNILLDVFENPDKFKINETTSIKDCFTQNLNDLGRGGLREIFELAQLLQMNTTGTRAQLLVNDLESIVKQKELQTTTTDILGKQVIGEMADVVYADETERQEQVDMEKMQNRDTQKR